MLVSSCNLRLARGQVQLKISKGPGSTPGFVEDQAALKTIKSGQPPKKKTLIFMAAVFELTLVSAQAGAQVNRNRTARGTVRRRISND